MQKSSNLLSEFKSITTFELVLTFVLGVALGVAFWGWTFVYELAKPALKLLGLSYGVAGFWILASILVAYLIRKPGIAILASLMAAFVQSLLTHWGPMSLVWGLVQGLGAEIIFLIFSYRKWNLVVVLLATLLSTLFSYGLDFFYYNYGDLSLTLNALQLGSYLVSALLLAGVFTVIIAKRLKKLGILDQVKIGRE